MQGVVDDPNQLRVQGQRLRESGETLRALDVFLQALLLEPHAADLANAVGVCYQETGQPAKALEYYLRALTLAPDSAEVLNNMGVVLFQDGDVAGSIEHLQQALVLDPANADAWNNLALSLREQHEYGAAIAAFRQAHKYDPQRPEIAAGLGEALSLVYNGESDKYLRLAVELAPAIAERRWNLGLDQLKRGEYAEGWRNYERRFERGGGHNPPRPFVQAKWLGETALAGKTILLHAEQGMGDSMQMLRYLPMVAAEARRVVVEVQPPLKRLMAEFARRVGANVEVLASGEALPEFDVHTAMMSLPLAFATTLETVPPPVRFTAEASKREGGPLRVGLAWSGNPSHPRDRERSMPFERLAPLLAVRGVQFVSLQVGPAARQAEGVGMEQPLLMDFMDTAAVLDTLDVVIAVDTAVVHLAASQGVPTWVALPFVADWRWLEPAKTTSAWYPAVRLFRPKVMPSPPGPGASWPAVVEELVAALEQRRG